MNEATAQTGSDLAELCAGIVAAYVSHNALSPADLPKLIVEVYGALEGLGTAAEVEAVEELKPAVPVRKSITPDFLICLEDGKKFKSLKRHLATTFNMTPSEYRQKWSLPPDYPMVAPNYAAVRSALAVSNGLGRKAATPVAPVKKVRRKAAVSA